MATRPAGHKVESVKPVLAPSLDTPNPADNFLSCTSLSTCSTHLDLDHDKERSSPLAEMAEGSSTDHSIPTKAVESLPTNDNVPPPQKSFEAAASDQPQTNDNDESVDPDKPAMYWSSFYDEYDDTEEQQRRRRLEMHARSSQSRLKQNADVMISPQHRGDQFRKASDRKYHDKRVMRSGAKAQNFRNSRPAHSNLESVWGVDPSSLPSSNLSHRHHGYSHYDHDSSLRSQHSMGRPTADRATSHGETGTYSVCLKRILKDLQEGPRPAGSDRQISIFGTGRPREEVIHEGKNDAPTPQTLRNKVTIQQRQAPEPSENQTEDAAPAEETAVPTEDPPKQTDVQQRDPEPVSVPPPHPMCSENKLDDMVVYQQHANASNPQHYYAAPAGYPYAGAPSPMYMMSSSEFVPPVPETQQYYLQNGAMRISVGPASGFGPYGIPDTASAAAPYSYYPSEASGHHNFHPVIDPAYAGHYVMQPHVGQAPPPGGGGLVSAHYMTEQPAEQVYSQSRLANQQITDTFSSYHPVSQFSGQANDINSTCASLCPTGVQPSTFYPAQHFAAPQPFAQTPAASAESPALHQFYPPGVEMYHHQGCVQSDLKYPVLASSSGPAPLQEAAQTIGPEDGAKQMGNQACFVPYSVESAPQQVFSPQNVPSSTEISEDRNGPSEKPRRVKMLNRPVSSETKPATVAATELQRQASDASISKKSVPTSESERPHLRGGGDASRYPPRYNSKPYSGRAYQGKHEGDRDRRSFNRSKPSSPSLSHQQYHTASNEGDDNDDDRRCRAQKEKGQFRQSKHYVNDQHYPSDSTPRQQRRFNPSEKGGPFRESQNRPSPRHLTYLDEDPDQQRRLQRNVSSATQLKERSGLSRLSCADQAYQRSEEDDALEPQRPRDLRFGYEEDEEVMDGRFDRRRQDRGGHSKFGGGPTRGFEANRPPNQSFKGQENSREMMQGTQREDQGLEEASQMSTSRNDRDLGDRRRHHDNRGGFRGRQRRHDPHGEDKHQKSEFSATKKGLRPANPKNSYPRPKNQDHHHHHPQQSGAEVSQGHLGPGAQMKAPRDNDDNRKQHEAKMVPNSRAYAAAAAGSGVKVANRFEALSTEGRKPEGG